MTAAEPDNSVFIPDFCTGNALIPVLVISQLVAIVVVLAVSASDPTLWRRLTVVSLYLHWTCLSSAAVLCLLRRHLTGLPVVRVAIVAYTVLLLVTLVLSEAAWRVGAYVQLPGFAGLEAELAFVVRNVLICAIVAAMVLRYFYVMHAWQRQVQAVANARYQALQARIRPHFLFNSLNSIAALIPGRPEQAEALVEDLAELFREILRTKKPLGSFARELELTRAYLNIEQIRLGERLTIEWDLEPGLDDLQVPLLCLQPLVENGVYHGVELIDGGGTLSIRVSRDDRVLLLEVENPVPESDSRSKGSRSAQDNIRQRLRLLFDDRARLETKRTANMYCARLEIPV